MPFLVDTNVILDLVTEDPQWADWSESILSECRSEVLWINAIVFAELSVGAESREEVEEILGDLNLSIRETRTQGLFLAGKAFEQYRSRSGRKSSPLPDFLIGGQAEDLAVPLITRDPRRYRTYFPRVVVITPK